MENITEEQGPNFGMKCVCRRQPAAQQPSKAVSQPVAEVSLRCCRAAAFFLPLSICNIKKQPSDLTDRSKTITYDSDTNLNIHVN